MINMPAVRTRDCWLAGLALFVLASTNVAAIAKPVLPVRDYDIATIKSVADAIIARSLPACHVAICVKPKCAEAEALLQPLADASALLAALESPLKKLRTLQVDNTASIASQVAITEDQVRRVRQAEEVQDILYSSGRAILDIANWTDFIANYVENVRKWRTPRWLDKINALDPEVQSKLDINLLGGLADHLKVHLDRIRDAYGWADRASGMSDSDQAQLITLLSGLRDDMFTATNDLKKVAGVKKWWRTPNGQQILLKVVARMSDKLIKADKLMRSRRLGQDRATLVAENAAFNENMIILKRINERLEAAALARRAIEKAQIALRTCVAKMCGGLVDIPTAPSADAVGEGLDAQLANLEMRIVSFGHNLVDLVSGYRLAVDLDATYLKLGSKSASRTQPIHASYRVSECIAEDANLVLYRISGERPQEVKQVPLKSRPQDFVQFFINENLSGRWADRSGFSVTLTANENEILLSWPDMPAAGQSRLFKGTLAERSEQGSYLLVLQSPEHQIEYLQMEIEVPPGPTASEPIALISSIRTVDDLPIRLPLKVRNEFVNQGLDFKARLRPERSADGELTIDAMFTNHSFRFRPDTLELDISSIREKTAKRVKLHRVKRDE